MTLSPGLQVFLKTVSALGFTLPVSTVLLNLYCLFKFDFSAPVASYIRALPLFSSQIIDFSALIVSIDCLFASMTRTRTPLLRLKSHGSMAVIVCIASSYLVALTIYITHYAYLFELFIFTTTMHIACLLTQVVLLAINIRRHKVVPFAYELSIRHKLVRNIKLLQLLCPFLFVATVLSGIGPVASLYLVRAHAVSPAIGTQLVYLCYNAAILSTIILLMWKCRKQTVTARVAFIKSNDELAISHFQQLKSLWK